MFDFSWSELALIAAVALVVIGPKDLPKALRTAGMWARKARTISREFQSSIEQMIREAELDEVKKQIETATSGNLEHEIKKAVDPTGSLAEALKPPELPDIKSIVNESAAPTPPASPTVGDTPPALPPQEDRPAIAPPQPHPESPPAEHPAEPPGAHQASDPSPEAPHPSRSGEQTASVPPSQSGTTS